MPRNTLLLLLALAACEEPRVFESLGGSWYLEEVSVTVFGGHSPVPHQELRRKVGDDYRDMGRIGRARFYLPDCLAWTGRGGWYFACGDRRPIVLPSWVLTAGPEGPLGGYITRQQGSQPREEWWDLLPLDSVKRAAMRAPPYDSTWADTTKRAALPKVWINRRPKWDAVEVR